MLQYFAVSYAVWAYEMGEVIRPTMWSDNGYIAFGALRQALGRWLKDISLFRDAWEIVPRTEWKILVESADLPGSRSLVCIRWYQG